MHPNRRAVSRFVLGDFGFILEGDLLFKKESFPVKMRDIASGGASFTFLSSYSNPTLSKNDFISFLFPILDSQIRFDAEVVWSTAEGCGVRFVEDLTRSSLHDLIRRLALSAS
jgi:hypothetical protein